MADDGITVDLAGLAELQAKIDALSDKALDRASRAAVRAGALVEQAAIVELAPVKVDDGGSLPEGALKSDFVIKVSKGADGVMRANVGPGKLTAHVARWIEYGHRMVKGGKSRLKKYGLVSGPGKQTGEVQAYPFIRPAFEASKAKVEQTVRSTFKSEISKAWKSMSKRR
jgi:HK97 gp10 family phage protein